MTTVFGGAYYTDKNEDCDSGINQHNRKSQSTYERKGSRVKCRRTGPYVGIPLGTAWLKCNGLW